MLSFGVKNHSKLDRKNLYLFSGFGKLPLPKTAEVQRLANPPLRTPHQPPVNNYESQEESPPGVGDFAVSQLTPQELFKSKSSGHSGRF